MQPPTQMIWKFELPIEDRVAIAMPSQSEVLSVQMQGDRPFVWALVDPKEPLVPCLFAVRGTGHPIDIPIEEDWKFIGTFQMRGGALVFHVFRIGANEDLLSDDY